MDGWVDGRLDEWVGGYVNGWMDGWAGVSGWISRREGVDRRGFVGG